MRVKGTALGLGSFFRVVVVVEMTFSVAGLKSSWVMMVVDSATGSGELNVLRLFLIVVFVGLCFWEVSADLASESDEEDEDEDEDEELVELFALSAWSFDVPLVGVGASVTLESEAILDSLVGFLNLRTLRSSSESLSEEVDSEVESGSEERAALAVDRRMFVAPVLLGLTCFSGLLSVESDSDKGLFQCCCLMPFPSAAEFVAPAIFSGFPTSLFVFFGAGSSSLLDDSELDDESGLELAEGGVLRFNGFVISMVVGFRNDAPRPAVSFLSSASLPEVEVADEEDEDSRDFGEPFAGFSGASFMSMSESLLSGLSSSLSLLLLCAAFASVASLFSNAVRFLFLIFRADLSSPSLLLVSFIFCFSA